MAPRLRKRCKAHGKVKGVDPPVMRVLKGLAECQETPTTVIEGGPVKVYLVPAELVDEAREIVARLRPAVEEEYDHAG